MKRVFLALVTILLLAGCQSKAVGAETVFADGGSYKNVTPKELNSMLKNKDFVLVNVHIPFAGNIPNTDLSIPYDQIDQNFSQLPSDKSAKIVLYCRSGHMSQIAAEDLVLQGYTNVWNLKGGMIDWEKDGFEIQK
jgi:rhodanese-related sulfurtransferase